MIPAKNIWLWRVEGPTALLGMGIATSFDGADEVLRRWAETAPQDGSYHKCDFKIEYVDESISLGCYLLKGLTVENPNLKRHIHELRGARYAQVRTP